MLRFFCMALQLGSLSLAGLAVAVFSVPFSQQGLVNTPSHIQAGLYLLTKMPMGGVAFLQSLQVLLWVPVVTVGLGFLQGIAPARLWSWLGVGVNAAALVYLWYYIPAVASSKGVAWPILGTALLFACSALLMFASARGGNAGNVRKSSAVSLVLLWVGSVGVIGFGVLAKNVPPVALAGVVGVLFALTAAFYCLGTAAKGLGAKKGSSAAFLLVPLALFAACLCYSQPLALPLGAGLLLVLAERLS